MSKDMHFRNVGDEIFENSRGEEFVELGLKDKLYMHPRVFEGEVYRPANVFETDIEQTCPYGEIYEVASHNGGQENVTGVLVSDDDLSRKVSDEFYTHIQLSSEEFRLLVDE